MIVDHFNTFLTGGAAVAARRLHAGLLHEGIDSRFWHAPPRPADASEALRPTPWPLPATSVAAGLRRRLWHSTRAIRLAVARQYHRRGRRRRFGTFVDARLDHDTPFAPSIFHGDIVHLHWIGGLIDYPSFFAAIPAGKPVVWTLHDMNPLTGGCSHAVDCDGFTRGCGDCPILARPGPHDLSQAVFQAKEHAIRGTRLHLVAPSEWMAGVARRSGIVGHAPVHVIRHPLDLDAFTPLDKQAARRALGLPAAGPCLLYAAESLENKPKGIDEYLATLAALRDVPGLFGLAFGRGTAPAEVAGVPLRCLGFLPTTEQQRLAYSAADVFVMPSHAETISQTIVEAFACGTPTVAFAVGGIPELVRDGETGFLAPPLDAGRLAAHARWLLDHPEERLAMGRGGMALVRREYDARRQVRLSIDLYERLLDSA
jgi:glycosyltransferase involved in cell wall biosynthesis